MHRFIPRGRALAALVGALSVSVLVLALPAVAADSVAPTIDVATLAGTPDGNANWRRTKPVTLNLSATDDVEVAKLQYSLDNGATYVDVPVTPGPAVSAAVSISQEGNTTVRYRAVDSSGNYSAPTQATTLGAAADAGATAVRLASTNGRAVGDILVIDTGANVETVTIASIVTPNPPSPTPNVVLAAPLALAHASAAPVFQTWRTIGVLIDTFAPVAIWATQATTVQVSTNSAAPAAAPAVGDTHLRLASTTGRAVGDRLVLDVAGNAETVTIASIVDPPPAAPAANVLLSAPLTKAHLAGAAVYVPAIVDGKILQSRTLTPLRTDPRRRDATDTVSQGAGGSAIRLMEVDGAQVYPLPLSLNKLAVGKHTQMVALQDSAGNAIRYTSTFAVTTSFDDLDTVVQQYAGNGHNTTLSAAAAAGATGLRFAQPVGLRPGDTLVIDAGANQETATIATVPSPVPGNPNPHVVLTAPLALAHASGVPVSRPQPLVSAATAANLRALLAQAKDAAALGNTAAAVDALHAFTSAVWAQVTPAGERTVERAALTSASKALADDLLGGSVDTNGTGVTTSPHESVIRIFTDPTPFMSNPFATYKVLITGRAGGFRHESIVDIHALVQQLGAANGFDVEIWDPQLTTSPGRQAPPGVSLPTSPFLDPVKLMEYKTIVFNSTVGINATATLNATEFANFQAYIRAGGGMVALHGAVDSMQNVAWYMDLIGAGFTNHGSNSGGIMPDCSACGHVELQTVDPAHPTTQHLADTFAIVEELYNTNRNPVQLGIVHPLVLENEATLVGQIGYGTGTLMNGDHGMIWCRNFDGGRAFTNVIGHSWQLIHDPWYRQMMLKAIQTTAGVVYGNCVTYVEVSDLIAASLASGGINAAGSAALTERLADAKAEFDEGNYRRAINYLDTFISQTKKAANCKPADGGPCPDGGAALAKLTFKGQELISWARGLQ